VPPSITIEEALPAPGARCPRGWILASLTRFGLPPAGEAEGGRLTTAACWANEMVDRQPGPGGQSLSGPAIASLPPFRQTKGGTTMSTARLRG